MGGNTNYLALPLPSELTELGEDVGNLRAALDGIDTYAESNDVIVSALARDLTSAQLAISALEKAVPPTATEEAEGVTRLATLAEHIAGASDSAAVPFHVIALITARLALELGPAKTELAETAAKIRALLPIPQAGDAGKAVVVDTAGAYALGSGVLSGVVFPFSGSFGGPEGKHPINRATGEPDPAYALCDGGTYTAPDGAEIVTPDLRERFILGAGETREAGTTGGAESHGHTGSASGAATTGTVANHTLTAAQMPSHAHSLLYNTSQSGSSTYTMDLTTRHVSSKYIAYHSTTGAGSTGAHSHAFTGSAHGHEVAVADASALPPFYALSFIMKL